MFKKLAVAIMAGSLVVASGVGPFGVSCPGQHRLKHRGNQNVNVTVVQKVVPNRRPAPAGKPNWHHGHDDFAGGVVGGIVGGVVGGWLFNPPPPVVVVAAPPPPPPAPKAPAAWSNEWYDYCNGKFKSFDAKTGYFTGYDGVQHFCN